MERITGYKLRKPEYLEAVRRLFNITRPININELNNALLGSPPNSCLFDTMKEAGLFAVLLEPIYEVKEYKVGDWVTPLFNCGIITQHHRIEGEAYLVAELNLNKVRLAAADNKTNDGSGWLDSECVEPSLPSKIKEAKLRPVNFFRITPEYEWIKLRVESIDLFLTVLRNNEIEPDIELIAERLDLITRLKKIKSNEA